MKKSIALFLAVLLLTSFSSVALAEAQTETTEMPVYTWDEYEPLLEQAGIKGDYYTFDSFDLQMWIPEILELVDRTDEQIEQGFIALASSEDDQYQMVIRRYEYENPVESIEEWQELLKEQLGIDESVICLINGLKVLEYQDAENDAFVTDIHVNDGSILEFAFRPFSDHDYATCIVFMVNSVMPETD